MKNNNSKIIKKTIRKKSIFKNINIKNISVDMLCKYLKKYILCKNIKKSSKKENILNIDKNFRVKNKKDSKIFKELVINHIKKNKNNNSIGENICRLYLEHIFKLPFPKIRPGFLKNPVTNSNLEIDCFNSELCLGLEYNGKQHYNFTPIFHKNKLEFHCQLYRDIIKRYLCKEKGIRLIEIPYTVSHNNIAFYIETKLNEFNI